MRTAWILGWLVAWLGLFGAAEARAQADDGADEATLEAAEEALERGEAETALRLARSRRDRSWRTLWTIGRAQLALGRPRVAHRFLRRALCAPGADRRAVAADLARARDRLTVVRLDVQPGNAVVTVDGAIAEWEPGERVLLLEPGTHLFEVRAEGFQIWREGLHVAGFQHLRVALSPGRGEDRRSLRRGAQAVDLDWMGSGLTLAGVGALATAGTASWEADRAQRLAALGDDRGAGAALRVEHGFAALHAGASLGLFFGAQAGLLLGFLEEAAGLELPFPVRLMAMPVLFGAAMASVMAFGEGEARDPADAHGRSVERMRLGGGLFGAALGLMGAWVLSGESVLGPSVAAIFAGLAELMLGGVHWAAAARAATARGGENGGRAARLGEEQQAHDRLGAASTLTGLVLVGVGATLLAARLEGEIGDFDLRVSASPGGLAVAGDF